MTLVCSSFFKKWFVQVMCIVASILMIPLMWIAKESTAEERLSNCAVAQHMQQIEFTISSALIIGASIPVIIILELFSCIILTVRNLF